MDVDKHLKEHWQELLELRDEFWGYAVTTKQADRERLEHAIAGLYSFAGFDPPEKVVWFASPVDALIAGALWIQMLDPETTSDSPAKTVSRFLLSETLHTHFTRVDNFIPDESSVLLKALQSPMIVTPTTVIPINRNFPIPLPPTGDRERHPMFSSELAWQVREHLRGAVLDTIKQRASDSWPDALLNPWNIVRGSLPFHHENWVSLAKSLVYSDEEKRDKVLEAVRQRISLMTVPIYAYFSPLHYTFHVASRLAMNVFGIDLSDKMPMPHLLDAVKAGGWWWPFQYVCFACENPTELHFNERMRLHNENGMALRFAYDWGIYAINGARVPEMVVKNSFGIAEINAEKNSTVRAIMIERFGAANYVREGGGKEIDRSDYGILYRVEHPPSPILGILEPIVMVKVTNRTPNPDGSFRSYFLRVPPDIKTAKEAVAWTFGLEEDEYKPIQES